MTHYVYMMAKPKIGMYSLTFPLDFSIGDASFKIPAGFQFDGASIPKVFWGIIGHPFDTKYVRAAAIHDFLYRTHDVGKKEADRTFRRILREDGVSSETSMTMYTAVRFGGHSAYKEGPNKPLIGSF